MYYKSGLKHYYYYYVCSNKYYCLLKKIIIITIPPPPSQFDFITKPLLTLHKSSSTPPFDVNCILDYSFHSLFLKAFGIKSVSSYLSFYVSLKSLSLGLF